MDTLDFSDFTAVNERTSWFDSYPQPTGLKRHQTFPSPFTTPVYNSIEDWTAADFATGSDSAPSPAHGSPVSPIFPDFTFSGTPGGEDWSSWDECGGAQSPNSDFFLKTELLEGAPDLTSIPTMSPVPDDGVSSNVLDDVVFGREGVNDTRPLFTMPPQPSHMAGCAAQSPPAPSPTTTTTQPRRYPARNSLKRKSSTSSTTHSGSSPRSSSSPPPHQRRHTSTSTTSTSSHSPPPPSTTASKPAAGPKKTAHNMIEKRYRTNLNDKITALRDAVPALRVTLHRLEGGGAGDADEEDEDEMMAPAHKLNKATILSKATEYIAQLERRNQALVAENLGLRGRVEGLEVVVMGRGAPRAGWS